MIFYDTETCGLHSICVLIQWAKDDGPIHLHEVFKVPIIETLKLIEEIINDEVVGFNLAFDHFHLCKLYTIFSLYPDKDAYPEDIIDELAELEPLARDGDCLKVKSAFDLMLHARKTKFQETMERRPITIRKVPRVLAWELADELEKSINFPDYLFARRKDKKAKKWVVEDIKDNDEFKNVTLRFKAAGKLKVLATYALGLKEDDVLLFHDIEPPTWSRPNEVGYAPFAKALGSKDAWNKTWPQVIKYHIEHWHHNALAREYAKKDVEYTRSLYHYFGDPTPGDDDSILACMVAASRWRGYKVDLAKIQSLKEQAKGKLRKFASTPRLVKQYILSALDETEQLVAEIKGSSKRTVLEAITKMLKDCPDCDGSGIPDAINQLQCQTCQGHGIIKHPAAERAEEVLDARKAGKEIELYDKILLAGRFHASFKIIGTLSSRMSGGDGLNAQGIKKTKEVRSAFPLAWENYILTGGDFSGFEVTIADAVYNDPRLRSDLLSGKKIHALFGIHVYPGMTYEEILATEGTPDDKYTRCKSAVFAMLYGGTGFTLKGRLGVDIEVADKAVALFNKQYRGVGLETIKVTEMFSSLKQPDGIGTKVEWHDPADYIESMYGFRRYFTLENSIIKALFNLGNHPPKAWFGYKVKVHRRFDRGEQTASGAVRSALFGAAFGIMSGVIRAAKNHKIQSAGASITKALQCKIWEVQPVGVHKWMVQPMNIHDEVQNPCHPDVVASVEQIVDAFVKEHSSKIPLLKIDWKSNLKSWADKS